MTRRTVSILCAGALLCGTSVAHAAPRTHDGFYLQLSGGLGYYHTSGGPGALEETFSGLSIPTSLMLGGTLFKHLVVGGGAFVDTAPSPSYKVNGQEPAMGVDLKQFVIGVGAFVDYYVWSDRGLHFPLFLGWGGLETSTNGNVGGSDPTGFITYFGGGYDWWISDNWSIGALFRLVVAPSKFNGETYTTVEPGVLLTLTFN